MARRGHAPARAGVAADAPVLPAHAEADRCGQVVIREGPRATGRAALLWDHRGTLFEPTRLGSTMQTSAPTPRPPRGPRWWRRHALVIILLVWAVVATAWR